MAYLTGGGAVNSSGAWITGAASPAGPSAVTLQYLLTVGGQVAEVAYLGLTPGFVGLYQANFTDRRDAGNVSRGGDGCWYASNSATIAVGD